MFLVSGRAQRLSWQMFLCKGSQHDMNMSEGYIFFWNFPLQCSWQSAVFKKKLLESGGVIPLLRYGNLVDTGL
jgi:hypothetical protein